MLQRFAVFALALAGLVAATPSEAAKRYYCQCGAKSVAGLYQNVGCEVHFKKPLRNGKYQACTASEVTSFRSMLCRERNCRYGTASQSY